MDTITGYNRTATGIELYTKDGNGYFLEVANKPYGNTQMFMFKRKKILTLLCRYLKIEKVQLSLQLYKGLYWIQMVKALQHTEMKFYMI